MKINYKRLIISLALPQLAGMVGSLFTTSAIPTWYATLQIPSFSPPNWLFGPVWILLYILMGVSFYLTWQKLSKTRLYQRLRTGRAKQPEARYGCFGFICFSTLSGQ